MACSESVDIVKGPAARRGRSRDLLMLFKGTLSILPREPMSAFGPKRTSLVAPHMSAFGGKAAGPSH